MAWWGWFFAVAVAVKVIARNFWKFGEDGRIGEEDLIYFFFFLLLLLSIFGVSDLEFRVD